MLPQRLDEGVLARPRGPRYDEKQARPRDQPSSVHAAGLLNLASVWKAAGCLASKIGLTACREGAASPVRWRDRPVRRRAACTARESRARLEPRSLLEASLATAA